jgi:hypothetical protein
MMAKPYEKRIDWQRIYHKYRRSSAKKRSVLLDELCDLTGMNRKYLIRKLNKKKGKPTKLRGAKPIYEPGIYLPIIKPIWLAADQICGKRLKAVLQDWLDFYEDEFGELERAIRLKVLQISSATLDRLLKPIKANYSGQGISGTKPGSILKNQIPIKTNQWEETKPGFMEADTVAHCGTSLEGSFVWSLTMTDILLTWTENRAVWNKGAYGVGVAIDDIEANLPFEIKGFDCDNGSEFLNYHLINKFAERPKEKKIQFTRSRPYKKNDNAHVEQKNWTHVRQLFGYHRFDNECLVGMMNDLYRNEWSLYQNHFIPTMKCIKKVKINSKYRRKFDIPRTPYQRVLDCPDISNEKKEMLKKTHKTLNPFELKRIIDKKLKRTFSYVQLNKTPRKKI